MVQGVTLAACVADWRPGAGPNMEAAEMGISDASSTVSENENCVAQMVIYRGRTFDRFDGLRVENTFITLGSVRSPSLEPFLNERKILSCPASPRGHGCSEISFGNEDASSLSSIVLSGQEINSNQSTADIEDRLDCGDVEALHQCADRDSDVETDFKLDGLCSATPPYADSVDSDDTMDNTDPCEAAREPPTQATTLQLRLTIPPVPTPQFATNSKEKSTSRGGGRGKESRKQRNTKMLNKNNKTEMCRYFKTDGTCPYEQSGKACWYAHKTSELR